MVKLKRVYFEKYNWEVVENFSIRLKSLNNCTSSVSITDSDGNVIIYLNKNIITICKGYQFDGCSCAPDFDRALVGCCVHDALIQLLESYPIIFKYQDAHDALLEVQTISKFKLRWVYYLVVSSWLGKLYRYFK